MDKYQEIINNLQRQYDENNSKIKKIEDETTNLFSYLSKKKIIKSVNSEIKLEKLKNENDILKNAINDLKSYEMSIKYQLVNYRPYEILSYSNDIEEIEEGIELKTKKLNEINQELEKFINKKILIEKFSSIRNLNKIYLKFIVHFMVGMSLILYIFPLIINSGMFSFEILMTGFILIEVMEIIKMKKGEEVLKIFNKELGNDSISYISDDSVDKAILEKTKQLQEQLKYDYISKLKLEFEKIKVESILEKIQSKEHQELYTNENLKENEQEVFMSDKQEKLRKEIQKETQNLKELTGVFERWGKALYDGPLEDEKKFTYGTEPSAENKVDHTLRKSLTKNNH